MSDAIHMLDPTASDRHELAAAYEDARARTAERKRRHEERWKTLLHRDVTIDVRWTEPLYSFERHFSRPAGLTTAGDERTLNSFVSQQTVRAEYNDRVADALGVAYLPSSVRLAPGSLLRQSKVAMLNALRQLNRSVTPGVAPTPYSTFEAPFLLGVLLEEMGSLDDFSAGLAQLRSRFDGFRSWMAAHPGRPDWDEHPRELYDEVPARVAGALPGAPLGSTLSFAAGVGGKVPGVGPPVELAAEVAKRVRDTGPGARLIAWLFRRKIHPLVSVAEEAKQIRTLRGQIRRLWGRELAIGDEDVLSEIAASESDELLKPRAID
jgi:hypothetical protein